MNTMTDIFTCTVCHKDKSMYWAFHAKHGQLMCLWCAEDSGLTKPRSYNSTRPGRRY